MRLSELSRSMRKLAILGKWTSASLEEVLAHLCLVFLFESIELTLISVEVVIITLLSQVAHHLSWWVIEVSFWLAILVELSGVLLGCFASLANGVG